MVDDGISDVMMTSEAVRVLAQAQAVGGITDAQAEALKHGLVWLGVRMGVDVRLLAARSAPRRRRLQRRERAKHGPRSAWRGRR